MAAVMFEREGRLVVVGFREGLKNRSGVTDWREIVDLLNRCDSTFKDSLKREKTMISMDLPEESIEEIGYLIQGLTDSESSESDLIKQLENHTTETIESVGKDNLQRAVAGGKLLRSVLSYLIQQKFSPLGCLILVHQGEENLP